MNQPKEAYIMVGIPGCGKSHFIKNSLQNCVVVSADVTKDKMPCGTVPMDEAHEYSVREAERYVLDLARNNTPKICVDGGGVNSSYTESIIRQLKALGYYVKIVFIDTPVSVCLERNAERNRYIPVPEIEIIRKSVKINECLIRYEDLVDEMIRVPHYTNKHIFMDMDGTMAAYQHIPFDEYGCINFIEGRYFRNAKPVVPVLEKIQSLESQGARVYVLSASPDSLCTKDKESWLNKNAPFVEAEDRHFIGNKRYKFIMLRNVCANLKLNYKDVTFVDDDHKVITDCHSVGINGVHPSMFLTTSFQFEGWRVDVELHR